MAKHVGLVVFPNGDVRYLVFNAFNDVAWPELFEERSNAETAWREHGVGRYDPFAIDTSPATDDEVVAMFPWADNFGRPGEKPDFYTKASRLAGAITGPRTLEYAPDDEDGRRDFLRAVTVKSAADLSVFDAMVSGRSWVTSEPDASYIAGLMARHLGADAGRRSTPTSNKR